MLQKFCEELHDLQPSLYIILVIKEDKMSREFGKYGREKKNADRVWWRHLKERDHLEDPGIDGG